MRRTSFLASSNAVVASVLFICLTAIFAVITWFGPIFTPLFLAFVLAWLLSPAVDFLVRKGIPRSAAALVVLAAGGVAIGLLVWVLVSSLSEEFGTVRLNLPEYANRLYEMIPGVVKKGLQIETPQKVYEKMAEYQEEIRSAALKIVQDGMRVVARAFSSTVSFLLALVNYLITPVYLVYLLIDFPRIYPAVLDLVPPRHRETFRDRISEIDTVLSAFVRGQLSVCAILAVLYSLGLYFIGIDLAFVIGIFSGATFIIPYLGTILGIVLSMLMALLKFHDLLHPLLCLGWFVVVQAAEGWILTPNLVGNRVGINPVLALVALLVFGQLFGLLGMLIAFPAAAVLKILGRTVVEIYRESRFYRESA